MPGLTLRLAAAPLRRPLPHLRRPNTKRFTSTATKPTEAATTTTTTTAAPAIPTPSIAASTLASTTASTATTTAAALPLWQRLGPVSTFFRFYGRSQAARPYTTQFVSTVIVYFLGDYGAQKMRGAEYEVERGGRAVVIGSIAAIPTYKWFMYLGTLFNYPSATLSLLTKVVVNQIAYTPLFNTYFFGMQALLSGTHSPLTLEGWKGIGEHIKRTVPTSVYNSCKLWPAVTAFSFTFVGPEYRSIFGGVIAVGWQAYLGFLNRRAEVAEMVERGEEVREVEEPVQQLQIAAGKTAA